MAGALVSSNSYKTSYNIMCHISKTLHHCVWSRDTQNALQLLETRGRRGRQVWSWEDYYYPHMSHETVIPVQCSEVLTSNSVSLQTLYHGRLALREWSDRWKQRARANVSYIPFPSRSIHSKLVYRWSTEKPGRRVIVEVGHVIIEVSRAFVISFKCNY